MRKLSSIAIFLTALMACFSINAIPTNAVPIAQGYLRTGLDGNGRPITNLSSVTATNIVSTNVNARSISASNVVAQSFAGDGKLLTGLYLLGGLDAGSNVVVSVPGSKQFQIANHLGLVMWAINTDGTISTDTGYNGDGSGLSGVQANTTNLFGVLQNAQIPFYLLRNTNAFATNMTLLGSNYIGGSLGGSDHTYVSLASGANNELPTGTNLFSEYSGSSSATIYGMANVWAGKILIAAFPSGTTIANNTGSGTAAYRIITGTGADLALANSPSTVLFKYDGTASRWRVINVWGNTISANGNFTGTFGGDASGLTNIVSAGFSSEAVAWISSLAASNTLFATTASNVIGGTISGVIIKPTNQIQMTLNVTVNQGTNVTGDPGIFTGRYIGDDIVIGVYQARIMKLVNASNAVVDVNSTTTFSTNLWRFYPCLPITDVDGRQAGYIANDGAIGIIQSSTNLTHGGFFNSGTLDFVDGTLWRIGAKQFVHGGSGKFQISTPQYSEGVGILQIDQGSRYETLRLINSLAAVRGLTNTQGNSLDLRPPADGTTNYGSMMVKGMTSGTSVTKTGTGTITFTAGQHAITGTGTSFTSLKPGTRLFFGSTNVLITVINSDTSAWASIVPGATVTDVPFTYELPMLSYTGVSPLNNMFVTGEGEIWVVNGVYPSINWGRYYGYNWGWSSDSTGVAKLNNYTQNSTPMAVDTNAANDTLHLTSSGARITGSFTASGSVTNSTNSYTFGTNSVNQFVLVAPPTNASPVSALGRTAGGEVVEMPIASGDNPNIVTNTQDQVQFGALTSGQTTNSSRVIAGTPFIAFAGLNGSLVLSNTITGSVTSVHTNNNAGFPGNITNLFTVSTRVRTGNFLMLDDGFERYETAADAAARTTAKRCFVFTGNNIAMSLSTGLYWSDNSSGSGDAFSSRHGWIIPNGTGGNIQVRSNMFFFGSIFPTNGVSLPKTPSPPMGITNGLAGIWNSNDVVFLRTSVTGTTNEGTDTKLAP